MRDLDTEVFHGLVVIARAKHPVPSRTRPLSALAPMVLRLKAWESRSPPNLVKPLDCISLRCFISKMQLAYKSFFSKALMSMLVYRTEGVVAAIANIESNRLLFVLHRELKRNRHLLDTRLITLISILSRDRTEHTRTSGCF